MRIFGRRYGLGWYIVAAVVLGVVLGFSRQQTANAFIGGGAGTSAADPYRITNCNELQDMQSDLDAYYRLDQNIDCISLSFLSVGNSGTPFTGEFDGQGYTISNLIIQTTADDSGLFGATDGATVSNLYLQTVDLSSTNYNNKGALVGNATYSTFSHIHATDVDIISNNGNNIGGLVGTLGGSSIVRSSARQLSINAFGVSAGGLVGYMVGPSSIADSYTDGTVSNNTNAGGIVGQIGSGPTQFSNTYSAAQVSAVTSPGDLVGVGSAQFTSGVYASSALTVGQAVSGWDFADIWFVRPSGYPGLRPAVAPSYLCSQSTSTVSQITAGCSTHPLLDGGTEWELQYRAPGYNDWINLPSQQGNAFSVTVPNLQSGTDYEVRFRYTDAIGTGQWGVVQATTTGAIDSDSDGTANIEESLAPNGGDANDDGTPDTQQANVISYRNPVSNDYAVFETDCQSIAGFQVGSESSQQNDKDFDYPFGLVSFHITCANPGDTARIRQYYYGVQNNQDKYTVRKWRSNGSYQQIPAHTLGLPLSGGVAFFVKYRNVDGGQFDYGGAVNGLVVDPSGAALPAPATAVSVPAGAAANLAATGQSIAWYRLLVSLIVSLTGIYVITRRSRRPTPKS